MEKLKLFYEKIKQLNYKIIIEAFFVSLMSGYVLSGIARKTYKNILSMEEYVDKNFSQTVLMLVTFTIAVLLVYSCKASIARILMFVLVYIYAILCAYNGYEIKWNEVMNNSMGIACFTALLGIIVTIAFLYAKDDIFKVVKQIKIGKRETYILVTIVGILLTAFIGVVTVLRYTTYSNATFDFGIFAQMYESMIQRGTLETTVERTTLLSHFGVHFSPIIYITYPIYLLFPSPITVQMIQAIFIALPILPIVLLCKKMKVSNWITVGVSLLYALYPATAGGTYYDMHENCFLAFGLLMTIWAVESKKNAWMVIFLAFTYFVKEDAAIYLLVFGTYLFLSRKDKKRGLIIMITSAVYFVVAVNIINSYGYGILSSHFYNLYMNPKGGIFEIVKTILTNPAYLLGQMVKNSNVAGMDKIEYCVYMFMPIAGIVFSFQKKYSRYILLAPLVVLNLFTTYVYQHSITFHYNYGIIALIVYLLIMNLSEMKHKTAKVRICVSVICASVMFVGALFPKMDYYRKKEQKNKKVYETINKALDLVPDDASVCSSGYFVPHLADHMELYDQRYLIKDDNGIPQNIYTDYLVVDERYSNEASKFYDILASGKYECIYEETGIIRIYKKIAE